MWAIIPVKPLIRAKSRLSAILQPDKREELSRAMLEHTVNIVKKVPVIRDILVISRDSGVLALANKMDCQTVRESGTPELNDALTRATQAVVSRNADGVLVLASDIPFLQVGDLEGMLASMQSPPEVIIAPDRHHEGTNALLVMPPGLIGYHYGPNSYALHQQEAQRMGVQCRTFESPTLGLDVDVPEDYTLYQSLLKSESLQMELKADRS